MRFTTYETAGFFDEMFEADGPSRAGSALLVQRIQALAEGELLHRQRAAEQALLHMGITFNAAEQRLGRLRSELDYAQIDEIIARGLHEFLDAFQAKLNEVGTAIFETFVALRPVMDVPTRVRDVR